MVFPVSYGWGSAFLAGEDYASGATMVVSEVDFIAASR